MILKRMYRSDNQLENFGFLEGAIESNNSDELDLTIRETIKEFHKRRNILIDHLLLESIELCLIHAKPDCLKTVFDLAISIDFRLNLRARNVKDRLSVVTLLSTAFQSEHTTPEEIFDCLIILYKFEPDLFIEKAAGELKSPADKISSFCFFIVQMLKFRSDLEETKIISLLQKADFNISIMLDIEKQQKDANTACPTIIHYFALYGKTDLLNWIFEKIKKDPKIKMKRFLEEQANFGEEIGLISVTPLICAITSHNVDTVSLLVKEGASDKEKCQLYHRSVADGRKDGRNKERRAKIQNEANSKSPLEICQNIKNKQIRVAMRCLLRNREQPQKSSKKSASNSPRKKNRKDQNQNLETKN